MIVLDSTKTITMTTTSGSNVVAAANFVDPPSTPNYNTVASNAATPVTIVASPSSGTRLIQHIDIFNGDASAQLVTVYFGTIQLIQQTIPAGWNVQYTTNGGWSTPSGASMNFYFPGGW